MHVPVGALLAAAVFVVYTLGACTTIYVGDSGELVAAVYVLGIPHPSGYPLYVLLGKLWTLLVPLGSIAYRMSLFSAACGAATVGILHALCRRAGLGEVASTTAALLLAFAPSFWAEANIQRAYTLNALFVMIATALAFEWARTRRPRPLVLAFLVSGLGATNHTYMGLFAIALGLFAVLTDRGLLAQPRTLVAAALAGAAGLLPYAFLPIRSRMDPPLDWGDPETLESFLRVLTRLDFWDRKWLRGPEDLLPITADYLRGLGEELLWGGAVLAALGAIRLWRRGGAVLLPLLAMAVNLGALAAHGSRSDLFIWHRYYIPSYALAAFLAGFGVEAVLGRLPRRARLLPLALPALGLLMGWRDFDRSRYRIAEAYSRTLLKTLPPGAHLAANDDNVLFVLLYLRLVEGLRPDVDLIPQGVGGVDLPPLHFNPQTDPLFFTHHPNWRTPALDLVPVGLVFQTVRPGAPRPEPPPLPEALEGERDPRVPKDYLTRNLIGEFHYMKGVTAEARDWPTAWREFGEATRASPKNDVLFYNLGLIFDRNGLFHEAAAAFQRSDLINPRPIASRTHAHAAEHLRRAVAQVDRLRAIEDALARNEASLNEPPPSSPEFHVRMAAFLEARSETLAARGHRLRAQVAAR